MQSSSINLRNHRLPLTLYVRPEVDSLSEQLQGSSLLDKLKSRLIPGFGISVGLIKEVLGTTNALVCEVNHENKNKFKLFMLKGANDVCCVIQTNIYGLAPQLLHAEDAKRLINSYALKGGMLSSQISATKNGHDQNLLNVNEGSNLGELLDLAKNKNADKAVLLAILNHPKANSDVRIDVAANKNADNEVLLAILNHPNLSYYVLMNVARNVAKEMLLLILNSHHVTYSLLRDIAKNKNADKDVLLAIIQHTRANNSVLKVVVENKNTDKDVLRAISSHPQADYYVLKAVVKHPGTDVAILKAAISQKNGNGTLLTGLDLAKFEFTDDDFPLLKFENALNLTLNDVDYFLDRHFNHLNNGSGSLLSAINSIDNNYPGVKTNLMGQVLKFLQDTDIKTIINPLCNILFNSTFDYAKVLADYQQFTTKLLNTLIVNANSSALMPTERELSFYLNFINNLTPENKSAFILQNNGFFVQCLYHGQLTAATKLITQNLTTEYLQYNLQAAELAEEVYGNQESYLLFANAVPSWLAVSPEYMANLLYGIDTPNVKPDLKWGHSIINYFKFPDVKRGQFRFYFLPFCWDNSSLSFLS